MKIKRTDSKSRRNRKIRKRRMFIEGLSTTLLSLGIFLVILFASTSRLDEIIPWALLMGGFVCVGLSIAGFKLLDITTARKIKRSINNEYGRLTNEEFNRLFK